MTKILRHWLFGTYLTLIGATALADGIGKIKVLSGKVTIERAGQFLPATMGMTLQVGDRISTAKESTVGMLFDDDSRMSLGPRSVLVLDQFEFDMNSHDGAANFSMKKGALSVISGKLTKKSPGALKVRTPAAVLAVRGTEFSVQVEDPEDTSDRP